MPASLADFPCTAPATSYDEAMTGDGLRPHWNSFARLLGESSLDELAGRREAVRRQLAELGATYNVYTDSQGIERPWALDVFPFVLASDEWAFLERGIAQRTRLFNALLSDVYGPRRTLSEGLLPQALVYANPAFLRPCDGLPAPGGIPLALHAVNLARRSDGSWCVLSDRTQAPSGLGYALANRIALSHALPDEFRVSQVRRLAAFFMTMRENLRALAPRPTDAPVIALLTPGPFNETYFEHAFLARYLGFTLVEGGDLVIRDRRACIKTLEGLRPVDVLLRRVDDAYSDPLELRADSCLGVPGLLGAVRDGQVTVVNAIGSAWLESPALHRYLPALSRALLGEALLLPGPDTLWCGDPADRGQLLHAPAGFVLKNSFGIGRAAHRFTSQLSPADHNSLSAALDLNPHETTAQAHIRLSHAPCHEDNSITSRPVVLRAFSCSGPQGVSVMPGGLTRVSTSTHGLIVSMQAGSMSKDTWVLSDGPVSNVSLLRPATNVIRLERAPAEVPSRVADNLFWLGRYSERLEDVSRILRCTLGRLTTESGTEASPELAALVSLLTKLEILPEDFSKRNTLARLERECLQLVFNAHRLGTVREVHGRLQGLAFTLRDRFSADTQRILSRLHAGLKAGDAQPSSAQAMEVLNHIILHLAAFSGLEMENMTRGHAWRFLDMGRRLERAVNIITLLQNGLVLNQGESQTSLVPILEIADSVMTYRRRYFGQPEWPTVADLLIADDSNPRSFAFQVASLHEHVQRLPQSRRTDSPSANEQVLLATIRKSLARLDLPDLCEGDRDSASNPLPSALGKLAADMRQVSDCITQHYFVHTPLKAG